MTNPSKVYCLVKDIIFKAKLSETTRAMGAEIVSFKDVVGILAAAGEEAPNLIVFDASALWASNTEEAQAIVDGLRKLNFSALAFGFASHIETDAIGFFEERGVAVVPRSKALSELQARLRS